MVVKRAKNIILDMEGVLKVEELSNADILNLIDIESNRDNDIIPVINQGLQECFKQEVSLVIFKRGNFRIPNSPTVILTSHDGKILGHDIFSKEEKERYENDENAFFLSDDFVIFRREHAETKRYPGQECFILPPVDFPELAVIDEIEEVLSSSPSTHSDEYLKERFNVENDASIATIIVSFSCK